MPFICVKAYPNEEAVKQKTAEEILEVFCRTWGAEPEWVTIAMEDVAPEDWDEKVVRKEILPNPDRIMIRDGKKQF